MVQTYSKISIENLTPDKDTLLSSIWISFYDGSFKFDLYCRGKTTKPKLEQIKI